MADSNSASLSSAVLPDTVPAAIFTCAEFVEKPLSHKVTRPIPPVPDPARLSGPNFLKWKRSVETTLCARQLFKHYTAAPLPVTHAHYAAWDAEEQFILGWLVTHTLTSELHDHFPHQKTVKCFWDQAQAFCGLEDNN